jgi:hypothetical protein
LFPLVQTFCEPRHRYNTLSQYQKNRKKKEIKRKEGRGKKTAKFKNKIFGVKNVKKIFSSLSYHEHVSLCQRNGVHTQEIIHGTLPNILLVRINYATFPFLSCEKRKNTTKDAIFNFLFFFFTYNRQGRASLFWLGFCLFLSVFGFLYVFAFVFGFFVFSTIP